MYIVHNNRKHPAPLKAKFMCNLNTLTIGTQHNKIYLNYN